MIQQCVVQIGSINEETTFTETTRFRATANSDFVGDKAIQELLEEGTTHLRLNDFLGKLIIKTPINHPDNYRRIEKLYTLYDNILSEGRISLSVMDHYNEMAVSATSSFNLSNVNVTQLILFNGNPDDVIVPYEDAEYVLLNTVQINSTDKENKSRERGFLSKVGTHIALVEDPFVINEIIRGLRNEE